MRSTRNNRLFLKIETNYRQEDCSLHDDKKKIFLAQCTPETKRRSRPKPWCFFVRALPIYIILLNPTESTTFNEFASIFHPSGPVYRREPGQEPVPHDSVCPEKGVSKEAAASREMIGGPLGRLLLSWPSYAASRKSAAAEQVQVTCPSCGQVT